MSDEDHFYFRGYVNKQNCRIWGLKNPKMIIEKPLSCDLTALDFLLWGYVKDKVYADAPQSIKELKEKIHAVIDEIEPQMCENVMEN